MNDTESRRAENREESPPIFSSWGVLYTLVLAGLITYILLFYIFTKVFS
ncbi:MAG: hypothetical protein ACYC9O_03320 [Candidatus Latescibacterota bacterium]